MTLTHCLITGISLAEQETSPTPNGEESVFWYSLNVDGKIVPIALCETLFFDLGWDSETKKIIEENRILLIGEFAKDGFKDLKHKVFHWDCKIDANKNHINLKKLVEEIYAKAEYPKTRKEKYDNLLKFLHKSQSFEGAEIQIDHNITFYGKLYFMFIEEMQFFLRELQRKGLIDYRENNQRVQFTFYGLEYVDTLKKSSDFDINMFSKPKFQIGLSFAGEDRPYVEQVAEELKGLGVTVFYDNYEQVDLWGKDLYQHLNDVYKNKCEYCIVFISEHYAKKLWTIHELKSAQTKAFNENKEYILPVRFDNTELPGINSTVGYFDCNKISAVELAKLAARKVDHG